MCMRERSEEHTSELQSLRHLVCRLLLENTIRSEEHTSELQSLRHLVCRLLLANTIRSEEHTSELQSLRHIVCRLLLEKTPSATRACCKCSAACAWRKRWTAVAACAIWPCACSFFCSSGGATRLCPFTVACGFRT